MSGECTSFSRSVFFFFSTVLLPLNLPLPLFLKMCILSLLVPKAASLLPSSTLCVPLWEINSPLFLEKPNESHLFLQCMLQQHEVCLKSVSYFCKTKNEEWRPRQSESRRGQQWEREKGEKERDQGKKGSPERWIGRRKKSIISHRFQRRHKIKHFPLR